MFTIVVFFQKLYRMSSLKSCFRPLFPLGFAKEEYQKMIVEKLDNRIMFKQKAGHLLLPKTMSLYM